MHEYGDPGKPVLLLLHGITDSGQCFPDLVARLGSSYRIVAPDALAHGGSDRFTAEELASEDPIEAMYAATEAVLEDVGPALVARALDGWRHGRGAGRAPARPGARGGRRGPGLDGRVAVGRRGGR